jgi:DNA polymerase (family X)
VPIQNSDVAETFEKVADLLEIEGENKFRVRAYRDAARTVGGHSRSVAEMVEKGEDLTELPGIGEDLAGKIREVVETGKLSQAEAGDGRGPRRRGRFQKGWGDHRKIRRVRGRSEGGLEG